ncbi:DDHD domain-containing protein [Gongronella butleri]|nr:DDHD domain-containing protein [Gongronella butleri]
MKACHHVVTDEPNGIQVLPILWRKNITFGMANNESEADMGMHMDDDGCPTLDEITLDGIPMYRMLVSDVFLDIPLYMTQKYRDQMTIIIIKEINRVYKLFLDRHPDFVKNGGKVSILGHSLGSLLALDVLSNQPFSAKEAATLKETDQALLQAVEQKKTPPLMFPVDNFFAVGSPLGIILLLRGFKIASRQVLNKDASTAFDWEKSSASLMDQHHISYYYPAVKHFYNIFHRSDPVAYRVEPLIARHFSAKEKPVLIPYIKGGLKGVLDASLNVGSGIAKSAGAMFDTLRVSWTNSFIRNFKFAKAAEEDAAAAAEAHGKPVAMEMRSISPDVKDHGARKLAMLNPRQGRVDFCLQEGILENAYFSALSVHMNYWQDLDVAAMLIREIYTHKLDESKPS